MRKYFALCAVCIYCFFSHAQNVGIGVPNPQNKLHVGGGFRLDTLTGVGGAGLVWHNPNGVLYGIKFSGNTNDVLRGDGTFGPYNPAINGALGWLLVGNSGTNPATNFIGTTDNQPLLFKVNNIRHGFLGNSIFFGKNAGTVNTASSNVGIGENALQNNTTIGDLVAIGPYALSQNTTGAWNVALGRAALALNTTGNSNTAAGFQVMFENKTGYDNSAFGSNALKSNTTGYFNTAMGSWSARANASGHDNTALGYAALSNNTTASFNTSVGAFSLYENETGHNNTAVGYFSMLKNTVGSFNTAMGTGALQGNVYGKNNTAYGYNSLLSNAGIFAEENTAIGSHALTNNVYGYENTAIGSYALRNNVSGRRNTALGYAAGYNLPNNLDNVTVIGFNAGFLGTQSNHVNIGNDLVTWNGGRLPWSTWSDKRMKDDVQENVPGLDFITRLKPVTYRINISKQRAVTKVKDPDEKDWEGKYDIEKIKMTGFLAQDVEAAAAEINYDFSGVHKPKSSEGLYSLQYAAFVVPLVKAVQEQQSIIEKQQKQIDELIKRIEALEKK